MRKLQVYTERGSAGKGTEELFESESNYSSLRSRSLETNQVEILIRDIGQTRDRNTSFQFQFNSPWRAGE